jgi:outer membrane protein TolC
MGLTQLIGVRAWAFSVLLVLGGCATFSNDAGFADVKSAVRERQSAEPRWIRNDSDEADARATVKKLLSQSLTADAAVQIALVNNRALQATYAELGIAEADLVQAGRLRNPGFTYSRLRSGEVLEIERVFLFDVLWLLTMPTRTDIEQRRFQLAKTRVAAEVMQVAADTRRAYYRAVAAQEASKYADQVKTAAEASAELARRMAAAGNFSKLDHAREQVFYAESTAIVARTKQSATGERERLVRLMGVWGDDTRFTLPDRLPDLPKAPREAAELEASALKQRLDVQAATQEAANIASSLGLTRVTGFINVLEAGYHRGSEEGRRETGAELELRLPIFDWGSARTARAEHTYMQAVNRAADLAVRARSEVREAYSGYRTAFDLAQHYRDEIVPLRKRISEENVLRYNGMLISVFDLLADARQQIASVNAYIEALRDFWVADANLELALRGKSPESILLGGASARASANEAAAGH